MAPPVGRDAEAGSRRQVGRGEESIGLMHGRAQKGRGGEW